MRTTCILKAISGALNTRGQTLHCSIGHTRTMRHLTFLLLTLVALAICSPAVNKYTTRYDNIDVDGILKSERLLKNYFNCIMARGPCTPEGQLLKGKINDITVY